METLLKDIRYGVRMLVRNPGFRVVSVIALALGIGADAEIFGVVNGVLLRTLPLKEPERLMMIRETKLPQFPEFSVASGNFLDWKKQNTGFERLIAFKPSALNLIGTGDAERLRVLNVTEGFFATLGAQPQPGRDFLAEKDQPGRNNTVILNRELLHTQFGCDSRILDQAI